MALKDTIHSLHDIIGDLSNDLQKVGKGNKSAAQRIRVRTITLERIAKRFRKESVALEKKGKSKWKSAFKGIRKRANCKNPR